MSTKKPMNANDDNGKLDLPLFLGCYYRTCNY